MIEANVEWKKIFPDAKLPVKKHDWDVGLDAYAHRFDKGIGRNAKEVSMSRGEIVIAHLGIACSLPQGFYIQVVPRSGLAKRYGLSIVNSPGTIDAGYQGEIDVILVKFGEEHLHLKKGERICQLILRSVIRMNIIEKSDFSYTTERGENGFGSTGRE